MVTGSWLLVAGSRWPAIVVASYQLLATSHQTRYNLLVMAQSFTCPSCLAGLDYAGNDDPVIRCAYCNNNVIVPEDLRTQPKARQNEWAKFHSTGDPSVEINLGSFSGRINTLKQFKHLVHDGQLDQAINFYQQSFGVDLSEASRIAKEIASGHGVVISQTSFSNPIPVVTGTQIHTSRSAQSVNQIFSDAPHYRPPKKKPGIISSLIGFIVFIILIVLILGVMAAVWFTF